MTKITYWMTVHLFEWLNATGHIHVIKSPEKIKHNGTLDGIAKELYYGYSDFSGREILFLGLLSFMFLFTAYSANIVALLQSATNDINSVERLLNSPLTCGAQDTEFNRVMFEEEDRPVYRSFWLKKAVPQGDQFFLSVEEGIRRMREVTQGSSTYIAYFTSSYRVLRIIESGVQSRSSRRVLSSIPPCGVGTAMFTAVSLTHVAPAYKWIATLYVVAVGLLAVEIAVYRRSRG
ncbi:hypothetical protein JYU34_012120 [Plutella xylostella]|uniref:Ionotropic glutamate receptor C-terminal domain-containing protein n=1 Tax=Plutella xylostella TaxID=51655 RepID=A0ABQ7QED6_PLUXY|nr:hypothetical protein JYU34_012120 [Plutella xylostella]